jgi:hypothetical protein
LSTCDNVIDTVIIFAFPPQPIYLLETPSGCLKNHRKRKEKIP